MTILGGNDRKQCYGKTWLCYSDHIKIWLSKDHPPIYILAKSRYYV